VTEAGLLAIGIEPMVKTVVAIRRHVAETPAPMEATAAQPKQRAGTKQAMLIEMLRRPEGGTMEEIMAATGWLAHTARGAMSGALGKKLGLVVTSEKDALRASLRAFEGSDRCPNRAAAFICRPASGSPRRCAERRRNDRSR
jgi:hypothetical protein